MLWRLGEEDRHSGHTQVEQTAIKNTHEEKGSNGADRGASKVDIYLSSFRSHCHQHTVQHSLERGRLSYSTWR